MDSRGATLGGSLLVPSVQELAKQAITTVPTRYIRPDRVDSVASDVVQGYEVPVIDMQRLLEDGDLVDSDELAKLHSACKDLGFFQFVNHGVSSSLLNKVRREIEELFNLPMEEKKKLWQTPKDLEGFGQAFVVSDDQKLDWADLFFLTTLPVSMRNPQLFQKLPLSLRENMESYSKEMKHLLMTILSQFSKALKMEANEMRDLFEDALQIITNGIYRSAVHRVIVNFEKIRMSAATFFNPNYEAAFGPSPSLVDQQRPPLFKSVTNQEYLTGLFSRKLDGKSYLDVLRTKHTKE